VRSRARRASGERRSPNMSTQSRNRMVADGEIVVLRCKNVVIRWFLTWWRSGNGAGFVVLCDKKNLLRGDAHERAMGRSGLSV